MKSQKKKTNTLNVFYGVLIVAVAVLAFQVAGMKSDIRALERDASTIKQISSVQQSIKLDTILSNLRNLEETRDYLTLVSLEMLSADEIKALEAEQPVIYSSLPEKALYRIVLSNENNSLLVIYDFEENKVLRIFALEQMQLS